MMFRQRSLSAFLTLSLVASLTALSVGCGDDEDGVRSPSSSSSASVSSSDSSDNGSISTEVDGS